MTKKALQYFLLSLLGLAIVYLCSFLQKVPPPQKGEYFYSSFLNNNFTVMTAIVLGVAALMIAYFSSLKPFLIGLSLIVVYPITALVESTVYRGSHNLIPFELVVYLLYALPPMAGAYLGLFIKYLINKKKQRLV